MNSTWIAKPSDLETGVTKREWYVVDATGIELGRLASKIATVLRGKHKPTFTPHMDTGGFVIVINASKVELTGRKIEQKKYHQYSGYPGGIRTRSAREVRENDPERMFREAVAGMLPKNRLARKIIGKLHVYGGAEHPHKAQTPQPLP